ncbi:EAL domain-containing protein, partial [Pseudacidovorax intermedius]
ALASAEHQWGDGMQSEEPNARFREAVHAWRGAAAGERLVAARHALESGRALITRIGNQSNLILDPDLDSYYTMSLLLLRFPELMELGAAMREQLLAHRQTRTATERTESNTRYFILEGRVDAVAAAIRSDYAEAFAAARGPLAERLGGSRDDLAAAIEDFRRAARAAQEQPGLPLESFDAAQQGLFTRLDTAWSSADSAMNGLLATREHFFFTRMWLHLGTALFLLMLILTAVFFVARQISLPLRRLSDVVDTVRRTGDHTLRAQWHSGDEIGRLVLGFNDMLAQLDRERQIQQELAASARAADAQRELVEAIPIPLMVTSIPGHEVLNANPPAQAWLEGRAQDPWAQGLEPGVRARFFQQLADRRAVDEFEVRWQGSGMPSWAVLSARLIQYQGQAAMLTAFTPINQLKHMEQRLKLWAKVFEASSEGILIINAEHSIITVNAALCRGTGHDLADLVGQSPGMLLGEDRPMLQNLWPALDKRGAWQGEVTMRRRDGQVYPAWIVASVVRDGPDRISHYIFTSIDISDRKRSEERIRYLALHDVLTGLPNRSLCAERLREAIERAQASGQQVGVLFIDLDRFKTINDSLGHHVGDALLRSVAQRFADSVRPVDTVSRLGGDEFMVILDGVTDTRELEAVVEQRILPAVREPHDVHGSQLYVSCSVGMAMYPEDGADIDTLMRHADMAMYDSKSSGRDTARFFTPSMNDKAQQRQRVESCLRHAIERDELWLAYQPRIDAATGRMVGVEALLRWESSELGLVPPAEFIPIAEESGQIVALGDWVIQQACAQHEAWRRAGLGALTVSLNMSAVQLRTSGVPEVLRNALARHQVDPALLEVELTESTLMETAEETMTQLHALKTLGLTLAIDDFGTGYSNLSYLNRFPIDKLKIDRSFVQQMLEDPAQLAIARAIIGLGHTLGLRVVAEGVERPEHARMLHAAQCDELQGYHYARPMPPDALEAWLRDRQPQALVEADG